MMLLNLTGTATAGGGESVRVGVAAELDSEGGGGKVIVGVKLDSRSRELLTWAMVKAAQPGDCVIALHVLREPIAEGTSSILSLLKTFDSFLAGYEGFCSLKQVDLKLKICRGDSVKKLLVKEVKVCGASKLVLGVSKTPHIFGSAVSVAKYCARKLPHTCWVLAVDNGKILFEAEGFSGMSVFGVKTKHQAFIEKLKGQRHVDTGQDCGTEMIASDNNMSKTLAFIPSQGKPTCSAKFGRSFIRRLFVLDWPSRLKANKLPGVHRYLRLPNQHSSAAIYPDQKHHKPANCKEDGAIIAVGIDAGLAPLCPSHDFNDPSRELQSILEKYSLICRLFSIKELLLATSNFAPENMVGKGGSSWVYRGCLPDGKELAVKILKPSQDVIKEFASEIEITTAVSHKNMVSLLGFCLEANYLLLVYNYLPLGSLEENLHGDKLDASAFCWNERYKVGLGVAEALNHLHNGCKEPVIHRDVKSSNILLLEDFEPQLSDFGLAQWASASSSDIVCTDVAGTFGYLAPEYFMHGKVTDKIDVYAFGVVLLELLSGRKPITISSDSRKGQESLVAWAKPILEGGKFSNLLDARLSLDIGCDEIERMLLAARLCIRRSPKLRPQMSIILKLLQGDPGVINWARQQSFVPESHGCMGDDFAVPFNIQSLLNRALLNLELDDSLSISSPVQNVALEAYLQGRWSCQSSFDQ